MCEYKEAKVLAIVLNYKTFEQTLEIVNKLKLLEYSNLDVLVVDNCSPNESASILRKRAAKSGFIFIENATNSGYAAGNNIGIRYAVEHEYKYSWILNNDLVFDDNRILHTLVRTAEKNPQIACVGPKIKDLDGNIVPPYLKKPTRWNLTLGIGKAKRERDKHKFESGMVYRVYGCCMLLRNSTMEHINYMDERTFLYCEEDILAERFIAAGAYTYYCADTNVIHLESMTVNAEQGKKSLKKAKTVLKSMNIYLKDYLHYDPFSRGVCLLVRAAIILIR